MQINLATAQAETGEGGFPPEPGRHDPNTLANAVDTARQQDVQAVGAVLEDARWVQLQINLATVRAEIGEGGFPQEPGRRDPNTLTGLFLHPIVGRVPVIGHARLPEPP